MALEMRYDSRTRLEHKTPESYKSDESRGNTGNTGNTGNNSQGEAAPVVAGISALHGAAPDCAHPETTTERMADGSTLIRCLTCRHLQVTPFERS